MRGCQRMLLATAASFCVATSNTPLTFLRMLQGHRTSLRRSSRRRLLGARAARIATRTTGFPFFLLGVAVGRRWPHAPPPLPMSVKPTACHWPLKGPVPTAAAFKQQRLPPALSQNSLSRCLCLCCGAVGESLREATCDVSILFFLMRRFCLGNGPPNLHVAALSVVDCGAGGRRRGVCLSRRFQAV